MNKIKKRSRKFFYTIINISIFIAGIAYSEEGRIVEAKHRCKKEYLNNGTALGRVQWALNCGYIDDDGDYLYKVVKRKIIERSNYKYPMFKKNGREWNAPTSPGHNCYRNEKITLEDYVCIAGCFTPDQLVWYLDGEMTIFDAVKNKQDQIMTLTDNATLTNLNYQPRPVKHYTESSEENHEIIYTLITDSGKSIKVTHNHPLVDSTGYIKAAEDFRVGDALIKEDGSFSNVIQIEKNDYFGKVYNVTPDSTSSDNSINLNGQIIVAQGFLSGSAYYQNEGIDFLNKYKIRNTVTDDLLE
tara:strand:- start:3566 stop:4465 length:900 start_codon:yes stop_codon:yes gene_type:complete